MNRQVCPTCALDEHVVPDIGDDGELRLRCTDCDYGWSLRPGPGPASARSGKAEELGVYDGLLGCVGAGEGWLEYGIVEHRFRLTLPDVYRRLVREYGHTSLAQTRYSASSFLAGALSQLHREGLIEKHFAPATGFWSYNSQISHWSTPPTPPTSERRTWHEFALAEGIDPEQWQIER